MWPISHLCMPCSAQSREFGVRWNSAAGLLQPVDSPKCWVCKLFTGSSIYILSELSNALCQWTGRRLTALNSCAVGSDQVVWSTKARAMAEVTQVRGAQAWLAMEDQVICACVYFDGLPYSSNTACSVSIIIMITRKTSTKKKTLSSRGTSVL